VPRRGGVAAGLIAALGAALPAPAARACEVPEDGTAPYRRLVARVKYLPETEAWAERMSHARTVVQYVLLLGEPRRVDGRCHWLLEVRAGDRVWKRFLVPAEGGPVIELAPAAPR
jgi:hypothetical protein